MSAHNLDEFVFENRNKDYGAYNLRAFYSDRLLVSFLMTCSIYALILFGPRVWEWLKPKAEFEEEKTILTDPKMIAPPPIDPKIPPPPPVSVTSLPPPKVSTIKFIPPEVAPDEQVIEEEPPKQEELKQAVAGTKTVQGDPEADPNELSFDQAGTGESGDLIGAPVEEEAFTFVEQMPAFPGGDLNAYLASNIKYPQKAIQAGIEGTVFVSFMVGSDGSISDIKILKGIGYGCDDEAIRVIKEMPRWIPGKQGGIAVKVRVPISVKFKMS